MKTIPQIRREHALRKFSKLIADDVKKILNGK
jgi:hypothetical protein